MLSPSTPAQPVYEEPRLTPAEARQRLIVALDFATGRHAFDFVDRLEGTCSWFKVGLELYLAAGATIDLNGLGNYGSFPAGLPSYGTYNYYALTAGATTYDPNGGLEPYVIFNLDLNYSMPVKQLGIGYLKKLDFDLNFINLFNKLYYQYFYRQITPTTPNPPNFPTNYPVSYLAGQPVNTYNGTNFADALAGQPFTVTFTATARF